MINTKSAITVSNSLIKMYGGERRQKFPGESNPYDDVQRVEMTLKPGGIRKLKYLLDKDPTWIQKDGRYRKDQIRLMIASGSNWHQVTIWGPKKSKPLTVPPPWCD